MRVTDLVTAAKAVAHARSPRELSTGFECSRDSLSRREIESVRKVTQQTYRWHAPVRAIVTKAGARAQIRAWRSGYPNRPPLEMANQIGDHPDINFSVFSHVARA